MTEALAEHDVSRFRDGIERVLGLQFDASKAPLLADVLSRRLAATRSDSRVYIDHLADVPPDMVELNILAADLTVGETYFLRNAEQFNALTEEVLPQRMRARGATPMCILSAGCSTGEEPYSLAISLHEHSPDAARAIIVAADINGTSLDKAKRAKYSTWALRSTPGETRDRWFSVEGREFALAEKIRSAVSFVHDNLAADSPLWRPEQYDVVFCRNMMMYFTPDHASALVRRIFQSLAPGGYLFLGHAETLRGLSTDFHLCHSHGTFYYRRKDGSPSATEPVVQTTLSQDAIVGTLASSVVEAESWVDAIRLASERVHQLSSTGSQGPAATVSTVTAPKRWDLARPFLLLQQERFAEALDLVESLPPDAGNDPDVSLLLAVLLAHNGMFARAEGACRRLLGVDELSAGAHYVMALCREGVGDVAGAIHHDQAATYVDPGFAMARVHLGLLARRRNDGETVRRELSHAITLLHHEDASRALLFGGGFGRDALIALCRSQIAAVRGVP